MSLPITACLVYKAARNEGNARDRLKYRMDYNKKHGAFSTHGCPHKPPCTPPTEAELADLLTAMPETYILFDVK